MVTGDHAVRLAAGLAVACLLACSACGHSETPEQYALDGLTVSHVVAPEPVAAGSPADLVVAVYLTIANDGGIADTLVAVESPLAGRAQVHEQMPESGMMMMMPVAALAVPAHGTARLAPGGRHIMLESLARPVAAGDTIPLVLTFRRAGRLRVRAPVVRHGDLPRSLGPAAPPAPEVLSLRLARSDGGVFDLADQRGKVVVVFFGYTHCPDLCPLTLANFASARRALGARAQQVRFVFVTVDPGRDSPATTMAYARQFDSAFIGLSGDSTALAAAQRAFHVASWVTRDSAGNVLVAHSASVFVVGRDGGLARVIPHSEDNVDRIAAVISEVLR